VPAGHGQTKPFDVPFPQIQSLAKIERSASTHRDHHLTHTVIDEGSGPGESTGGVSREAGNSNSGWDKTSRDSGPFPTIDGLYELPSPGFLSVCNVNTVGNVNTGTIHGTCHSLLRDHDEFNPTRALRASGADRDKK